jgi:crossover junction endodeoxyribonuclease RusA
MRLPFPPSTNNYYRSACIKGSPRVYISEKGKTFRAEVGFIAHKAQKRVGRLWLDVRLSSPTRRRYDLDNRLKAIQDALQHSGVYDDDEQIDKITVHRDAPGGGYAIVTLYELPQADCDLR